MSLLDNFPHTATFKQPTHKQSAIGGDRPSWTDIATGLECWVQSANHNEVVEFAKRYQTITHTVYLAPSDAELLSPGDKIAITAGPSYVGESFEVRSVGERSSGLEVLHSAMVELLPS